MIMSTIVTGNFYLQTKLSPDYHRILVMHKLSFIPTVQAHACNSHKFVLENDCMCVVVIWQQHFDSF